MKVIVRFLTTLVCASLLTTCTAADTIVGLWRSEASTNSTVEFAKDGVFHLNSVIRNQGKEGIFPLSGTYKIADTNHVIVEIAFTSFMPTNKTAFNLAYEVSGDELQIQTIDIEWHLARYHRVKDQ